MDFLPLVTLGLPIASAFNLSLALQSRGNTLYLAASTHHRSCNWRSFSGYLSARSLAWVKSESILYNSHFCLSGSKPLLLGYPPAFGSRAVLWKGVGEADAFFLVSCSSPKQGGKPIQVTALTEVFGDGQKTTGAIIEYTSSVKNGTRSRV